MKEVEALREKVKLLDEVIVEGIQSMTDIQRADLFASSFDNPEEHFALPIIEMLGFDANYLAYLSIKKNSAALLTIALAHGASCADYIYQEKTLLQEAIAANKEALVKQILDSSTNLDVTLVRAIRQTDIATLDALFQYDKEYLHKSIYGYTALQVGISNNNLSIVDHILKLDPERAKDATCQKESSFKVALRGFFLSSNPEIIKSISKHVNVEEELKSLIDAKDIVLLETALNVCQVSHDVLDKLRDHAMKTGSIEIAYKIKASDNEVDVSKIHQEVLSTNDKETILSLVVVDSKFVDALAQNHEALDEFKVYLTGDHV